MGRDHTVTPTRRRFLSAGLVGLTAKGERRVAGGFVEDALMLGHRLRDRSAFGAPRQSRRIPLVIIGGGIAGLSAAWRLHKRGFRDFVLLEMRSQAGGNSRWGENEVSAFPWAAHYVPVPGKKATLARELFEDLGVLRDGQWEERHLCHSPQERLFLHGRWQEGLLPETAATSHDREQYRRFQSLMDEFRAAGEFAIPIESGARKMAGLDQISMMQWMRRQEFDSPYLNWYVGYACRDDYGSLAASTSAWAGIHYFASRDQDEHGPLTWAEGNGWIVRRLMERLRPFVRTGAVVHRLLRQGRGWRVLTEEIEYSAECVIFAAPTFLLPYLCEEPLPVREFVYSPWLTANLTLDRPPRERGVEPAWDNVIYGSRSLGYVVATHQSLRTHIDRTVWTYYWALADDPAEGRQLLLRRDWNGWKEAILADLERAHPDIRACVSRIDILRMGHAMIRPRPGFVFSEERQRLARLTGTLLLANSDLSGLSLFEEAQYRGVMAAERALRPAG